MKKIILIFLLSLLTTLLLAQDSQDYYVGTWKWEDQSSNSEIIIQLKTYTGVCGFLGNTSSYTVLVGAYSYKKDGVIVANFLNEFGENYSSYASYPIAIWDMKYLGIRDFLLTNEEGAPKYIEGSSRIEHVSSNPDKIKWILVDDATQGIL
jgi:hypothetical protein